MESTSLHRGRASGETGAALLTVILVSVLLLTASIALLSALGANSANSTDVLSETKAYYAAETGLQATINILRYNCAATYNAVKDDPSMLTWIDPDYVATDRVVVGKTADQYNARLDSAYTIYASDPDNIGGSTTFRTEAYFLSTVVDGSTIVDISDKCLPSASDCRAIRYADETNSNSTTIHLDPVVDWTTMDFTGQTYHNKPLVAFRVENVGAGVAIPHSVRFEVRYMMSEPRSESKTIYGTMSRSVAPGPASVQFNAREYSLMGSFINICDTDACVVTINPCETRSAEIYRISVPADANGTTQVYANITPVQPTRMHVKSTGYGPQSSKKILEAIIQRNFFDNLGSSPAISMIGPTGAGFVFEPGTSSGVTYNGGSGPSFGVTDPTNLEYLLTHPPGPRGGSLENMQPPPALITDVPSWQQSPEALNAKIAEYRLAAQGSGTYYTGGGDLPFPPGNNATGTGITFCEGNCKVTADGGGILVVTGQLTNVGDFDFKGLIIVTGVNGWLRNGGGNGTIQGSIVIAPYDPNNLAAGFLAPKYQVTGGGSSDVVYTELDTAFDGNVAATDFVQGVAEK